MTSRKRNVFRRILPDAYISCSKNCGMVAKLRKIMKEKDKTIRLLRQQNARLHSYLNDMSGKIEQFKVELHNLTEKSMEKQICNLKPQVSLYS
ncbi:hypothetical protein GHT06_001902 [Daphnia sinensis]|uniref:Uncharacterized protein n=1 Tax=Daphnia sinensis TaxID=1820382 RepID=A0AAD5PLQ6_9CRUS|nr:hypothetical protein GHT06_001902 [Daphnia sinensis]